MPPDNFFEEVQAHTKAKHDILRQYLRAWFPIMATFAEKSGSKVMRYIDGFAGQGKYESGENGSPVIALDVVSDSKSLKNRGLIFEFLFFEETPEKFHRLEEVLSAVPRPPCVRVKPECGTYKGT